MKTWLQRSPWALLLIVLLIAGVRLAVIASPMETGWEVLLSEWRNMALTWIDCEPMSISQQDPPQQADFWLREVDDVLARNPETAELCMGAAWVLDAPGNGYRHKYLTMKDFGAGIPPVPDLDYDAIRALCSQFEDKCQSRCLALAARATELEPDDVRWWRMRAFLLFSDEGKPRNDHWRDLLKECSQRDPENALYNYLAARALWDEALELDFVEGDDGDSIAKVKTQNQELYEEGNRWFEQGQKKTVLAIGEAGYPAISDFLSRTRLSRTAQAEVAVHRNVTGRQTMLFAIPWRWMGHLASTAELQGDMPELVTLQTQKYRLFEQAVAPSETSAMNCNILFSSSLAYSLCELQQLAEGHPELIQQDAVNQLVTRAKGFRTEAIVLARGVANMNSEREEQEDSAINTSIVAADARIMAGLLMLLAAVLLLAARLLGPTGSDDRRLGFARHTVAWLLGIGTSLVLLGLAPAEVISREVQTSVATAFAWGFVVVITAYVAWKAIWFGQRRRFQYRILTLLGCMTAVTIFAWIWPVLAETASKMQDLTSEYHIPAKGFSGLDADTLKAVPQFSSDKRRWTLTQWNAHHGPYFAVAIPLSLIAAWYIRRSAKAANAKVLSYWTEREPARWSGLFRCLASSGIAVGSCALLLHLWLVPVTLRVCEAEYQYRIRYCRNPAYQVTQIEQACDAIRAFEEDMEVIRAEAEADFAQGDN